MTIVRTALLLLGGLVAATSAPAQTLAITGATVIDGTGRPPVADGVVLITDGRIAAVGRAGEVTIPDAARRIDARGKYVIPGLMDANLHLMLNIDLESLVRFEGRYDEIVLEAAQIALKTGQTTVFDTWGPRAALVKVRDLINAGQAPGSRIYLAGNIIGFDGPLSADFIAAAATQVSKAFAKRTNDTWEQGTGRKLIWMTPDSVRSAIRAYTKTGVNFLKYGASGHQEMSFITFSMAQQKAIIEEGHRAGMTVQAHTTSPESLDLAIEAGLDIVTHGDISGPVHEIPDETIRKLVERKVAVSVLPVTERHLLAAEKLDQDAERVDPGKAFSRYAHIGKINERKMIKAGVTMLLSTDSGIENPVLHWESLRLAGDSVDPRVKLGDGHFNALVALEEEGMEPMEILKTVTSNIAKAYKVSDKLGTLEPGKAGDLVILDANPLESARNYRRISSVIKDGKVVDLATLPVAPVISKVAAP